MRHLILYVCIEEMFQNNVVHFICSELYYIQWNGEGKGEYHINSMYNVDICNFEGGLL